MVVKFVKQENTASQYYVLCKPITFYSTGKFMNLCQEQNDLQKKVK